jgi:hypothetical protein
MKKYDIDYTYGFFMGKKKDPNSPDFEFKKNSKSPESSDNIQKVGSHEYIRIIIIIIIVIFSFSTFISIM